MVVLNSFVNDARVYREAKEASKNFRVTIFARHADHLPIEENICGISVTRHSVTIDKLRLRFVRPLRYLELAVRFIWAALRLKPTVVHAHDLNALPIGYLISRFTGAKLIYDAHEMWSEQEVQQSLPRYLQVIGRWFEKRYAKKSDSVITVSDSIARELKHRFDLKAIHVIRNLPSYLEAPVSKIESPLRKTLGIGNEDFVILYQGGLSSGRGIEFLVKAFLTLDDRRLKLVLLGDGSLRKMLESMVPENDLGCRVFFLSAVPHAELLDWTAGANVGVHPMEGTCLNHKLALPNKLFEYIQARLPVIVSDMPEMSAFVEGERIGLVFKDTDVAALASCIVRLANERDLYRRLEKEAARVANAFTWEQEGPKLLSVYEGLGLNQGPVAESSRQT
ncbi:glycosyltransferase family 4 protein [Marinobacter algicola]|uniref:glycosyltransferase family 4 protein n=1 Tax=Marinobacter algicola TaxID=236100 RepID=UPI003BABC81C